MAAVTFASKLKSDGSLALPEEAIEELGIHPGDEVQVRVEAADRASHSEKPAQADLQARFECFFDNLDTLHFEKSAKIVGRDPAEAAFTKSMDEKYLKLGFRP